MSEHARPGATSGDYQQPQGGSAGMRSTGDYSTIGMEYQSGPPPRAGGRAAGQPTKWVGWIWFGAIVMMLNGLFNVIDGLVALYRHGYYVVGPSGLLVLSLSGWGWLNLILGIVIALAGLALLSGAIWARVIGVVLVAINALAQLAFLPAAPVWGTIMIALDIIVIWAIVVHGSELRES